MFFTKSLPKENRFINNRGIGLFITLFLASCTYAPKTTKIDNTYNARQMAVGMGDQPTGAMSSTLQEDESPSVNQASQPTQTTGANNQASNGMPLAKLEQMRQQRISGVDNSPKVATSNTSVPDYITIGSTKADVIRVQGTPAAIDKFEMLGEEWWNYGTSRIVFKNGKVYEWHDYRRLLKVKM
jgi:hypothetical protein